MYKFIHRIFGFYVLLVSEADAVRLLNLLTEKRLLFWRPEHCEGGLRLRSRCLRWNGSVLPPRARKSR